MSYADVFGEPPPAPKKEQCPKCMGRNTHAIYRPEVYEFPFVCRDCDEGFTNVIRRPERLV